MVISKRILRSIALTAAVTAAALPGATFAEGQQDPDKSEVIAVVNGETLTKTAFVAFVNMRLGQHPRQAKLNQQQLNALLSEYINRELIYQDALAKGWDKTPEVKIAIDNQRRNIIAGYAVRRLISAPVSEQTLKEVYEQRFAKPTKEYRTSHILVKTEEQARELISALENGADFGQLAKENSIDASAGNGGSLGWLSPAQMLRPFRETLPNMETGTYSKTPVESEYGWHILRLDDTRIIPPPTFESVQDQLRRQVQSEIISNYIAKLRENSRIEIK